MVSAYDDPDTIQKCKDLGAKDYVTKPVSFSDIKAICDGILITKDSLNQVQPERWNTTKCSFFERKKKRLKQEARYEQNY